MEALLQGMLEMGVGRPGAGHAAGAGNDSDEDSIVFEGNL